MACADITSAFNWAKQTSGTQSFPVTAFLTIHAGGVNKANPPEGSDICWYGVGVVALNAAGHLAGRLQAYTNGTPNDAMQIKPGMELVVDIAPSGTSISYQQQFNQQPVGGAAPQPVTTTCLNNALLYGTTMNAVVALGLRRDPPGTIIK
jgi:hypothetical protein